MQLHDLKRKNPNKRPKRVGRGGKRGKTSGRGTKGQKARAGHRIRPEMRDTIKKISKRRGMGKNRARTVHPDRIEPVVVNLAAIERLFSAGEIVNQKTLLEKGLVRMKKGKMVPVKILGTGDVTKKLTIERCLISKSAREKIEKAGGTISIQIHD